MVRPFSSTPTKTALKNGAEHVWTPQVEDGETDQRGGDRIHQQRTSGGDIATPDAGGDDDAAQRRQRARNDIGERLQSNCGRA